MTLYEILIALAQEECSKIHIDLPAKTISVGRHKVLDRGKIASSTVTVGETKQTFDALIEDCPDLDALYAQYKRSVPSERDGGTHYFYALPPSMLSDADLVFGMQRLEARVRLEAGILLASVAGLLHWHNPSAFYMRRTDPDFIILKKYID